MTISSTIVFFEQYGPHLLVFLVLGTLLMLYCLFEKRRKETFTGVLRDDEYTTLSDLIKALDNELDMLQEPWFLCCGNVLGYCRHGGPIPWDDDFDVCVSQRAFDSLTNELTDDLAKRGLKMTVLRDGLAKLYFIDKGKEVVYGDRVTRFPFIDVFAYTVAKEDGPTLRDKNGLVCSPGDVHMSRATVPRCMPKDVIFPLRRVKYEIPNVGSVKVPIPNKPGHMIGMLYGPGAMRQCLGRFYDHSTESPIWGGGQLMDCKEVAEKYGIKLEENCTIPDDL